MHIQPYLKNIDERVVEKKLIARVRENGSPKESLRSWWNGFLSEKTDSNPDAPQPKPESGDGKDEKDKEGEVSKETSKEDKEKYPS